MDNTFIHAFDILDKPWFNQYLASIFWSVNCMVSNIEDVPENKAEMIFTLCEKLYIFINLFFIKNLYIYIVMILAMTGIFGYVLNTIGMILSDIEKKTQ